MHRPSTITVDGPAASGKSTLAQALARELDYLFFDTGVMYRAVTLAALQRGVPIDDEAGCTRLAETVKIDVQPPSVDDGRLYDVCLDGVDVTWAIRKPEVNQNVSPVSAYPGVRTALTEQQRRIGQRGEVVMVGRDIGTVVLPDADLKIYLDASVEERARRRYQECLGRGETADYEGVQAEIRNRDQIDSNRTVSPLRPADDARIVDTDSMDATETLTYILGLVRNHDG
ncbi:MAG: (d)CMP kinase [Anaerolineales bacterium]|nr:(d)CMP kinase [Anaerolineales bacterium]